MNDDPWIGTGRVDPDGYVWSLDKTGRAVPTFVGKPNAIATEAAEAAETVKLGSVHEGAGRKASPSTTSGT